MRLHNNPRPQAAQVLVTTLFIAGLTGLLLVAYMSLASRQHHNVLRGQAWASEIPLAEAGIEEALAHINHSPVWIATTAGWTNNGTEVFKRREMNGGYWYASISTSLPPTIVSIGFAQVPGQTNYSRRVVMVTTKGGFPGYALLARDTITSGNSCIIDSFNSSDPLSSTLGQYDPLKRRDQAGVATLSSATPAINVTGPIYGYAATGPGGTVQGTVGDAAWVPTHPGQVQPGHVRDDLNLTLSSVEVPFTSGYFTPGPGIYGGLNYAYLLGNGDYYLESFFLVGGQTMLVYGNARLYVAKTWNSIGEIRIGTSGSLAIYIGGPTATFGGAGIVNSTQSASKCKLYGLPTLTDLEMAGSSLFVGTVYAPDTRIRLRGTADIIGALVGRTFDVNGNPGIHYDEALGGPNGGAYRVMTWEEL